MEKKNLTDIFEGLKQQSGAESNEATVSYQINFTADQANKDAILDKMLAKLKEIDLKEGANCISCHTCGSKTCKCM